MDLTSAAQDGNLEPQAHIKIEETISVPDQLSASQTNTMSNALLSLLPEHNLQPDEHGSIPTGAPPADVSPFHFDENTLRSLQQFMESQGLHAGLQTHDQNLLEGVSDTRLSYLPIRPEAKIETEEERKARSERVRLENRERKKKWREQNADRNKDNDLRCRVNKRANLMYGMNPSAQKTKFIENEFRKRRSKRRGRAPTPPGADNSDGSDNMYAAMINNPEFANVLMNLLAQKGLDAGDTETSAQLVELLKSNPDFLRGFLPAAPEPEQTEDQSNANLISETQQYDTQVPMFEDPMDLGHMGLPSHTLQFENLSMGSTNYADSNNDMTPSLQQSIPAPAPIPRLEVKTEVESIPDPSQSRPTPPLPSFPPIPAPSAYMLPPVTVNRVLQAPPSQERVRALGFPPMMAQPPR